MERLKSFLFYNNAVPVAAVILALGGASAFAATNPDALYKAQQSVVSIDNTYISSVNLDTYTPTVRVIGVSEDDDNYYVAYDFTTIALVDEVWQDAADSRTIKVSKADLGPYRDLGVYVTGELKQVIDRELQTLRETQMIERRNVTQKQVATAYSGLIGALLDSHTDTIPGYTPVVTAQPPPPPSGGSSGSVASGSSSSSSSGSSGGGTVTLYVLGKNPAYIPLRASYIDLGATIISPLSALNLGVDILLDGVEVSQISLDTSTTTSYTITYKVTDQSGAVSTMTRTVNVYDPATFTPPQTETPAPPPPAPEPMPEPLPEPAPEPAPQAPVVETSAPETSSEQATSTPPEPETTSSTSTASSTPSE